MSNLKTKPKPLEKTLGVNTNGYTIEVILSKNTSNYYIL